MRVFLFYAFLGVVMDCLITLDYRLLALRLAFPASALAVIITLTTFAIFNYVIKNWDWKKVVGYAAGTGVGTWLGVLII